MAAVVGALLVGVLLARGGTAATTDELAAAVPSPDAPTSAAPSAPPSAAANLVDLDGVADLRLGTRPAGGTTGVSTGEQYRVGTSDDGRCALLRPELPPAGLDVLVWEVDGVVEAVVMVAPGGASPARTTFRVDFGDDLAGLALEPGAVRGTEAVPGSLVGAVGHVEAELDGVHVLASDLGDRVGVQYLEVRTDVGRGCRTGTPWDGPGTAAPAPDDDADADLLPAPVADPVLDTTGRGPLVYGLPTAGLQALGFAEVGGFAAQSGCDLWVPDRDRPPGTGGVDTVWTREGEVTGIGVVRGRLAEGLEVGDDVEELFTTFPELAVDGADGPLLPPFPAPLADGRRIDVGLQDTYVVPASVDALLPTPWPTVTSVTVWSSPCGV